MERVHLTDHIAMGLRAVTQLTIQLKGQLIFLRCEEHLSEK